MNIFKISQLLAISIVITFLSCSKSESDLDLDVCTSCVATLNGNSSVPAEYCGSEAEVLDFEADYHASSQLAGATSNCDRQ